MLSFELSAIDLILAIAIAVLLVLYITKPSGTPKTERRYLVEEKTPKEVTTADSTLKEKEEKPWAIQKQADSPACPFTFKYLRNLEKTAPVPDACLSCVRIMECSGRSE